MLLHLAPVLAAGLPGGWELWIILFIILVLFGTRLPKVARSLGQGISEFKKGVNEPLEPDEPESNATSNSSTPADEKKDS